MTQSSVLNRMIVGIILILALFVVLGHIRAPALAASPPSTMNFQGRLTDSTGNIMSDGSYNMRFSIYDAASGGTELWTETREATARVQLTNGLFSTQLGEVAPLPASVFDNSDLYFEITMATPATANCSTAACASWESPMTPRNKLATSAYAFNAATLNGQSASDFAAASGSANYVQNTTTVQTASFNISGTGRVGGAFTVDGNATFGSNVVVQTATNSSNALSIQNASGMRVFNVNTDTGRVYLGEYDNNAALFILDTKTSSADPTGYNGSMYYNESRGKMRCYENGAWKNCDTGKGTATAQTSNYNAKDGDFVIADSSGGSFTITLPAPTDNAVISIKKVNSGNNISVNVAGGVQIDNLTTVTLSSQWVSQDFFSDGTQWYRV